MRFNSYSRAILPVWVAIAFGISIPSLAEAACDPSNLREMDDGQQVCMTQTSSASGCDSSNLREMDDGQQVCMSSSTSGAADVQKCIDAEATNKSACGDPNSTSGMNGGEQAQLASGLGMITMMGAQAAAAKGSAKACLMASTLNIALQGMALLKANTCQRTINQCVQLCTAANKVHFQKGNDDKIAPDGPTRSLAQKEFEWARKSNTTITSCRNNNSRVQAMQMQMVMLGLGAMNALNCQSASSSTVAAAVPPPRPLSAAVGDCSSASFAATSTYCICKSNPSDALCGSGSAGAIGSASGVGMSGGVGTPGITAQSTDSGQAVDTTPVNVNKGDKGMAAGSGGGAGGGLGGGGGGGLNPDGGGDGTGNSGIDKNVITGASGAGSGAGLSAVGGGAGGASKPGGGSSGGAGSSFNLSKYLPKNLFQNRGLAGMTVPAQDGMTGPLGPTIWEKVHTRYEDKKSTLIQDK